MKLTNFEESAQRAFLASIAMRQTCPAEWKETVKEAERERKDARHQSCEAGR